MKKIFKAFTTLLCTVCALVLVSCGGGSSKPISYEEFHSKAVEAEATITGPRTGHIVININTKYEHINYEGDFTVDGDSISLSEEPFLYNYYDYIYGAIKSRASDVEEGKDSLYYYNAETGFTYDQMFNDEISYQKLYDVNGYLTKAWDPSLEDNYVTTITWNE